LKIETKNHVWYIHKSTIKKFILEALLGFILWTTMLSPYMFLVVKVEVNQYISWLSMQGLIVPFCSIVAINVTNKVTKRILK